MFRKLALTGASVLALSIVALAATPLHTYRDSVGGEQETIGVECINNTTGEPESCGGAGGGGGDASAANQVIANTKLDTLHTDETNLLARVPAALGAGGGVKVDGSGTALPISAASLPLPAGAATAANQTALAALFPAALGASGGLKVESQSTNVAYADSSITSATGASQTLVSSSSTRKYLLISNPGSTTWWLHLTGGTAAANCAGCVEVPPGVTWTPRVAPTGAITGIGTTASKLTIVGG